MKPFSIEQPLISSKPGLDERNGRWIEKPFSIEQPLISSKPGLDERNGRWIEKPFSIEQPLISSKPGLDERNGRWIEKPFSIEQPLISSKPGLDERNGRWIEKPFSIEQPLISSKPGLDERNGRWIEKPFSIEQPLISSKPGLDGGSGRWIEKPFTTIATLLVVCLAACKAFAAEQQDTRPNILFIMSDDHGYQAIGAYGSKVNQTPNLDRIAKEGMRFDRCFVTNSICGPCRAVILTGKYSHLNGFIRNGNTFNGSQQNVAKLLRKGGYQTAVVGKWHLKSEPTGFDYWHILIGQGPYYNPPMKTPDGIVRHEGYTTDIITDQALHYLKNVRKKGQPFYLMYQHKAPHRNWQPGPKYLNKYDNVNIPEPATLFDDYSGRGTAAKTQQMTVARHLNMNDLKLSPQRGLTDAQRALWDKAYGPKNKAFAEAKLEGKALVKWKYQRYAKDYLRCVDSVDDNVGRVLDYLEESGLAKNTIVVYTSDQGWYLGEHGWYDKRWMYEESFRTPLLIRWPGKIKPGSVSKDMVMNLDFAQTFLDIAGVKMPADMQGRSMRSVLLGKRPDDWRQSVYYHYYEYPGAHSVRRHYGVRNERYKLMRFYRIDEWELYDLQKDPHELKSVYDDPMYAGVVAEMKAELKRLQDRYKDEGEVVDPNLAKARQVKLQTVRRFDFGKADIKGKLVDGRKGKAVELTGQSALLTEPTSDKTNPAYKPMTVGAWVKPDSKSGVILAQGGVSQGYSLYLRNGTVQFSIRAEGQLKTIRGGSLTPGKWSHVVAILDGEGRARLLVNGQRIRRGNRQLGFVTSQPADGLSIGADTGSLVGKYETSSPLSGQLQDVRLYWGVLPEADLADWAQ